ncbi:amidase family protein [Neomesorhizobium albiziae]|uniref:amidase family protein n=1 Tax=Neomesorhizobium albiziae TaxID=335020 RepID=UPI0024E04C01|nr:amidase family protein [Mesorhizobium albiziae]
MRIPSSCCGIAGLRPSTFSIENFLNGTSHKRYSSEGMVLPAGPLDTFGPMARTVADVAFLDSIITGEASGFLSIAKPPSATPNGSRRGSNSPRCARAHA